MGCEDIWVVRRGLEFVGTALLDVLLLEEPG